MWVHGVLGQVLGRMVAQVLGGGGPEALCVWWPGGGTCCTAHWPNSSLEPASTAASRHSGHTRTWHRLQLGTLTCHSIDTH